MINANYYIAISGRVLSSPRRYFTGFLVDLETEKNRYDMVVKERREIETTSTLSRETIARNKIIGFAKKEHAKDFGRQSVEVFNSDRKPSERYYNFKKMLLGLFAAEVEKRGVDITKIDLRNINYIIGEAK